MYKLISAWADEFFKSAAAEAILTSVAHDRIEQHIIPDLFDIRESGENLSWFCAEPVKQSLSGFLFVECWNRRQKVGFLLFDLCVINAGAWVGEFLVLLCFLFKELLKCVTLSAKRHKRHSPESNCTVGMSRSMYSMHALRNCGQIFCCII